MISVPIAADISPGAARRAEPPREAVSVATDRRQARLQARRRWLARGIAAAGAGLIPWMIILAVSLPGSARAAHWAAAWVGLDALEALGLIATGLLLIRRDSRYCLTAAATAVLLLADAWLDLTTASGGSAQLSAAVMALFAELPMGAVCTALAITGSRRQGQ